MIDTVRLLTRAKPTEEHFRLYWRRFESVGPQGDVSLKWAHNAPKDGPCPVRATYRPDSMTGPDQLTIELSVPKFLLGNNWEMVWDIQGTVPYLDAILAASPALPPLASVAEMVLSRLDVCYNHQVGDNLTAYIEAFSRLRISRRVTVRFNTETIEFRNKAGKGKFYDKHAETKGQAPAGILRHEITLPRAFAVKRALHARHPVHYGQLTLEALKAILDKSLDDLGLSERCLLAPSHVSAMLVLHHGATRGLHLFGIWSLAQTMDRAQIATALGIKRNGVSRHLADIKKAGLALTGPPTEEPLPPLRIIIPEPIPPLQCKICTQTPGITPGSLAFGDDPGEFDDDPQGGEEDET